MRTFLSLSFLLATAVFAQDSKGDTAQVGTAQYYWVEVSKKAIDRRIQEAREMGNDCMPEQLYDKVLSNLAGELKARFINWGIIYCQSKTNKKLFYVQVPTALLNQGCRGPGGITGIVGFPNSCTVAAPSNPADKEVVEKLGRKLSDGHPFDTNPNSKTPEAHQKYLGLTLPEAKKLEPNLVFRLVCLDGNPLMVTEELRTDRVNVYTEKGKIVFAESD